MGHLATLISDLALLLVVAGATTLFCKKINQQYHEESIYSRIVRTRYVQCFRVWNDARNYLNRVVLYYAFG